MLELFRNTAALALLPVLVLLLGIGATSKIAIVTIPVIGSVFNQVPVALERRCTSWKATG